VVWVIRNYQPDVIIARFPGDARAGHGHHAASSILAQEAYTAAADPKRFPEQLKYGVKPWQAKRILWNTFNFGGNNTTTNDQFKLEVGVIILYWVRVTERLVVKQEACTKVRVREDPEEEDPSMNSLQPLVETHQKQL